MTRTNSVLILMTVVVAIATFAISALGLASIY